MRIEFGFQANCSSLMAEIWVGNKDELLTAMTKVQELSGWTWRVDLYTSGSRNYVLVPVDELRRLLVVREYEFQGEKGIKVVIALNKLFDHWGEMIPEKIMKDWGEDWPALGRFQEPQLMNLGVEEPLHMVSEKSFRWYLLKAGEPLFYPEKGMFGFFLGMDHHDLRIMPIFHWLRKEYDGRYFTGDGGSTRYYEYWLDYHFGDREKDEKWELDEDNEESPPLPNSSTPDVMGEQEFWRWLRRGYHVYGPVVGPRPEDDEP